MSADTVKMRYTGPGDDKRVLDVSPSEAKSLKKTGLWSEVKSKSTSTKSSDKKESS